MRTSTLANAATFVLIWGFAGCSDGGGGASAPNAAGGAGGTQTSGAKQGASGTGASGRAAPAGPQRVDASGQPRAAGASSEPASLPGATGDEDAGAEVPSRPPLPSTPGELRIAFSPMYSAFDGVHVFKLPSIVLQAVPGPHWFVEPEDAADLQVDPSSQALTLTLRKAGDFKVFVTAGSLWGLTDLHVTQATPQQWTRGEDLYRDESPIDLAALNPNPAPNSTALPNSRGCAKCHGANATAFHLEHTPQQLGGYSDDDLSKIFISGAQPPGSSFKAQLAPALFAAYHSWKGVTEAEARDLIVYLRSLEPRAQPDITFVPSPRP